MTEHAVDEVDERLGGRRLSGLQITAALTAIVLVGFVLLLASGKVQRNGVNFDVVGSPAPPVRGVSYQGTSFDLEDVLARNRTVPAEEQTWVVLNFFGSWCAECVVEHPALVEFDTEGVTSDGRRCSTQLVGVTFDDSPENVRTFFEVRGGDWPVLVSGEISAAVVRYGVTAAPETIVIAPSGIVVEKFAGAITYADLADRISC